MKQENKIVQCACGGAGQLRNLDGGFAVVCEFAPKWYTPVICTTARKAINHWNKMQTGMDNLARDVTTADHKGISYGRYIPIKGQAPRSAPAPTPPVRGQEKRPLCAICGGEIPKTAPHRRKYCSTECAGIAMDRQLKEANCRRRKRAADNT